MDDGGSIGHTLRIRREERSLSMEQAAFQRRVPLRLVQVLESDDYHLVPDAFYLIRVLHDYARFLGLDASVMEHAFRAAIQRHAKPVPMPGPAAPAMPSVSWRHVAWTGAGILVVVPLVFIALSLSSQQVTPPAPSPPRIEAPLREDPPAPVSDAKTLPSGEPAPSEPPVMAKPIALAAVARPAEHPPAVERDAGFAPATTPVAAVEPTAERKPRRLLLLAEAVEPTWMAVRSDGGEQRQVLLRSGEKVRFGADASFVVTLGNAGGVKLSLNGERLPVLGKSGEVVRNLALPQDGGARGMPPAEGR